MPAQPEDRRASAARPVRGCGRRRRRRWHRAGRSAGSRGRGRCRRPALGGAQVLDGDQRRRLLGEEQAGLLVVRGSGGIAVRPASQRRRVERRASRSSEQRLQDYPPLRAGEQRVEPFQVAWLGEVLSEQRLLQWKYGYRDQRGRPRTTSAAMVSAPLAAPVEGSCPAPCRRRRRWSRKANGVPNARLPPCPSDCACR